MSNEELIIKFNKEWERSLDKTPIETAKHIATKFTRRQLRLLNKHLFKPYGYDPAWYKSFIRAHKKYGTKLGRLLYKESP